MPVNKTDKRYSSNINQWRMNRDAYRGQRAIHAAGEIYLPSSGKRMNTLTEEGRKLYEAFKNRTLFFNATGNTVDGLVGLIFRKDPVNTLPDKLMYLNDSADRANTSLKELQEDLCKEVMLMDIAGIHVAMPMTNGPISKLKAKQQNVRPYISTYNAENIIKIFYSSINNISVLDMVVLREYIYETSGDEFEREEKEQYRVLDLYRELDDEGNMIEEPVYRERVFDESNTLIHEVFPLINGKKFNYIPFEIVNINGGNKSPVEDLVHLNINHFQMNASYTWGVYQTGFPTPTATGIDPDNAPSDIGPGSMWISENADAEFKILEATAGGADKGKAYLDKIEMYMAALGADMLRPMKMASETAESKRLDKQAQYSTLSTIAQKVGDSMQRMLKIAAEWVGADPKTVSVHLNRDYYPTSINANMFNSLLGALQSQSISYKTFWDQLQRGEVAPTNRTAEQELELIKSDDSSSFDNDLLDAARKELTGKVDGENVNDKEEED